MADYGLDLHGSLLLDDYRRQLPLLEKLQQVVMAQLKQAVTKSGLELNQMESRIKGEASLAGKLLRKGSKYHSISDVTDLLGVRVITYYNEDVDRIASIAETLFEIDWSNSVDKRKMHQFDSFGYNSLHFVCRVPKSLYSDPACPELNEVPFELQMRTVLQHLWSDIQHDIGYKSEIETPMEYHRALSRLAGLLELADNEFSRIRTDITDYRRRIRSQMEQGRLEKVPLDGDTFTAYLQKKPFEKLNRQIAAINQAELYSGSLMPYLPVLRHMGMQTVADVERMMAEDYDDAYQLAVTQLGVTDLDILSETIGLQNLCIVHIIKNGGGQAGIQWLFDTVNGPSPANVDLASMVMEHARRLTN